VHAVNAKIRRRIYYSLVISLLIHLGFLVGSFFVKIIPNLSVDKPQKLIHVRIAKEESLGQQIPRAETNASEKSWQPENPFAETKTLEPSSESKEAVKDNIASGIQNKNEDLVPSLPRETENFKKPPRQDVIVTQKVKRSTRKNLIEVGEIPHDDFTSGAPVVVSGEDISKDFFNKSNLVMKVAPVVPSQAGKDQNEFQVMQRSSSGNDRKNKTGDLGTTLIYELYEYHDPKSGQKYFKLLVKVRDATVNFPVIPKEIIFLVDASQSIGQERLQQFEQGLAYSLNRLNPDDRFNIIIFKDKTIFFSPTSLKSEAGNIKKAINLFQDLKAGSKTDIYNALQTSINLKDSFVPSYRVLLSDGLPTTGIVNSRQVIDEVSKINNERVSIFAFGGGVNVSEYMLDFLAYKNRGWSQIVDREYFIGKEFSKMYDKIKDPLLLNLRYHISGLNEKEIFPQILPDFFKGSEFVIYGTYTDENKFFVQVLGDVLGETKEFIVHASFKEASAGNKEIARQWAFHKIYHLIGELKYNENNEALIKEIDALCTKFEIVTPYSRSFRELPKPREPPKPQEAPQKPNPDARTPVSRCGVSAELKARREQG